MGPVKYAVGIAIPSLIGTQLTPYNKYHSQLWEVTADLLGGAQGYMHNPGSEKAGWIYLVLLILL